MDLNLNRNQEKESSYRTITFQGSSESKFMSNRIYSESSSLLLVIPNCFLHNFSNTSFLWFIVLIGLELSPFNFSSSLKACTIVPLISYLLFSLLKTFHDTLSRLKHDRSKNEAIVKVLTAEGVLEKKTCDICVGDYLLIQYNEAVPADIIILAIDSLDDDCFIDMTAIVGGKNLTQKRPVKETQAMITEEGYDGVNLFEQIENVKVSQPNNSFQKFSGKIKLRGNPKAIKVDLENFIVRDSISECKWIVGLAVYTGMETKMWINSSKKSIFKLTEINNKLNNIMTGNFLMLWLGILICLGFSFLFSGQGDLSELVVSFIFLFHPFIPVSLYICLLLSKIGQMLIINFKNPDFKIKNPNILECLGRVEYVLSGKSGVLTDNEMTIQVCVIGKRIFLDRQEYKLEEKYSLRSKNSELLIKEVEFLDRLESEGHLLSELINELEELYHETEESGPRASLKIDPDIWYFVLCLTVCSYFHTEKNHLSNDEMLLLGLAEKLGYKVNQRSLHTVNLKFHNVEHSFDVLSSIGMFSEEKQSKVVIKDRNTGEVVLLIKGKIETIIDLFDNLDENMALDEAFQIPVLQNLQKIIFGYKILSETESKRFDFDLKTAKLSPVNTQGRISSVFEKYQKNLKFLGLVGIENPIKPGVYEAIKDLSTVGIKTWIVTGDSEESALLTGAAIGLNDSHCKVIKFSKIASHNDFLELLQTTINQELFGQLPKLQGFVQQSSGTLGIIRSELNIAQKEVYPLKKQITTHFKRKRRKSSKPVESITSLQELIQEKHQLVSKELNFVISIDSTTLQYVFNSRIIRKKFSVLIFAAKSVIFHSMMPDHKVKLVRLLKLNLKFRPTILAIGDGNTNAGMLREADIGISAQGVKDEHLFARDAQICSFACLAKLIIKFGHLGEVRISKIIHLSIYKVVMLSALLFLTQIQSGFSAFNFIDYDLIVLFDLCISLVPIVITGVFYSDCSIDEDLLSFEVYSQGYFNELLSKSKIFISYFEGNFHACVIYIMITFGFSDICSISGKTDDSEIKGVVAFILVNLAFCLKTCFENRTQPFIGLLIIIFIFLIQIVIVPLTLSNYLTSYSLSHLEFQRQPQAFFIIFLTPAIILIFCILKSILFNSCSHNTQQTRIESFKDNIEDCFVETNEWVIDEANNKISNKLLDIKFESKIKEDEYQQQIMPSLIKFFQYFLVIGFFLTWIIFILNLSLSTKNFHYHVWLISPPIAITINVILVFYKKIQGKYFLLFMFFCLILFTIALIIDSSNHVSFYYPIFCFVFSIGINSHFKFTLIRTFICFVLLLISRLMQVYTFYENAEVQLSLPSIIGMLELCILNLIITRINDMSRRKEYCRIKQVKSECRTYKSILSYLLPEFIRKRVKEGERYIAEDKGTVSVVFLDMCNFDDIVIMYSPQELTGFLDDVFGKIDKICQTIGVTKIETVGKTYLACAGLKDSEKFMDGKLTSVPHARRAIELGLAVIREVQKIVLRDGNTLMFKVGINSGPVTAGVVGFHKPQFSLVGDTINTASRMSSTLKEPNSIQISMNTYNMIGEKIGLNFKSMTQDVKGKGLMDTKIVTVEQNFHEKLSIASPLIYSSFGGVISISGRGSNINSDSSNPKFLEDGEIFESHDTMVKDKNLKYVNDIISFRFKESTIECEFREKYCESMYEILLYSYVLNLFFNIILLIIEIIFVVFELKYSSRFRAIVFSLDLVTGALLLIFLKKFHKKNEFGYLAGFIFSIDFIAIFIFSIFYQYPSNFFYEILCMRFIQLNYCTNLFFNKLLVLNLISLGLWYSSISLQDMDQFSYIFSTLFVLGVFYCKYIYEAHLRNSSIELENATRETEKTEELLTNMMPQHALKDLKDENFSTDRINNVSVMYADIVGFTAWSSVRQPKEVVLKLSQLFTTFDKLCLIHNVYKVHTIGDCYVVMGFQSDRNRNPAKEALNVVKFAQSLIRVIEECNNDPSYVLSMRVGIHTGEVIGGITGTNIVRYDIYGADVLIANKMESNGDPGRVVVSETTKGLIDDYRPEQFSFELKTEISIPALNRNMKIFRITDNEVVGEC